MSKIIDVSDCDDDDNALINAVISSIYIKSKTNSDNVVNEIELVGTVSLSYQIYSISDHSFITDSYMPHYNTDISKEHLSVKKSPIYYYDDRSDEIVFDSDKNIMKL